MSRPLRSTGVAFLAAFLTGCEDQPLATNEGWGLDHPPISFARKIRGGGFDGTGTTGPAGEDFPPNPQWIAAADIGQDTDSDGRCRSSGYCSVGSVGKQSFAGLGIPPNPNPNEDDGNGGFAVISTTNFRADGDGDTIVTIQSAMKADDFELVPAGRWQLLVDLAFLTGEVGPNAQNDFARVAIQRLGSKDTMEVIRLSIDDPPKWREKSCSPETFAGITSEYPLCTDWIRYAVDVSRFGGQAVEVEIRIGEGGADNGVATSLAIDNLKFNRLPTTGPIGLSPSAVQAGRQVEAKAGFSDGDFGDTHRAAWDWGDGTSTTPGTITRLHDTVTSAAPSVAGVVRNSHTYRQPGTYTITLAVTDIDGGVARTRRRITVR